VTVFSPNDISGLRRPKNVKFGTKVASSMKMMNTLRFLEKGFNCHKICKKMPIFQKHSHGGDMYKCRNIVYVVPPCEWFLHTLPKTVQSTEDPVMIVTLLVLVCVFDRLMDSLWTCFQIVFWSC